MPRKAKEPEKQKVAEAIAPQDDSTLWTKIPSVKAQIEQNGFDAFDPVLAGKVLGLLAFRCLERGLASNDNDVPLYKKMDWSLRVAPVISQLQNGMGIKEKPAMPETEALVDNELSKRLGRLKTLATKDTPEQVETILTTLAPQAAAPPEEA